MQCCSYSATPVLQPALQPLAATWFSSAGQRVDCCIPAVQPTAGNYGISVRHRTSATPNPWAGLHSEPTSSSVAPAAALTDSGACAVDNSVLLNPESADSTITSQAALGQTAVASGALLDKNRDSPPARRGIPITADASVVAQGPAIASLGFAAACIPQHLIQQSQGNVHPAAALACDAVAAAGGDQAGLDISNHTLAATDVELNVQQQAVHGDCAAVTVLNGRKHDDTFSARGGCVPAAAAAMVAQAPAKPGSAGDTELIADVCDNDALQAAAQLLMLQSAVAEGYTDACYGFDIAAAAAAATAAEHSNAVVQGYALHSSNIEGSFAVAADEHMQLIDFSGVRKRPRKPQLQQQQPSTVVDTVASTDQQQDQQHDVVLASGRRSKRARKTSYKAAEAAAFEDTFAELLQPAWLPRNSVNRSAADAVALDAGYGDQHVRRKASHQHLLGSSLGSAASSEYEDSELMPPSKHLARKQRGAHLSGHGDAAAARARGCVPLTAKRCLVRTSSLPVATAVQQKLQHVLSFFPDVQLPGAALPQYQPLQQHTQPTETLLHEVVADSLEPVATAAAFATAGNASLAEPQQLESPSAGTRIEVSPPPAPVLAALGAGTDSADVLQQVEPQHQVVGVSSVASSRPRRTPKPNTMRRSSSPAPRAHKHYSQALQQHPLHQYPMHDAAATAAVALEALAAAAPAVPGNVKNKGGRPRGSGNKRQMAPRATDKMGRAGFALRSAKYTGVYQSRRAHEGWRAQFCFSNKVLNLGTYATEDDAARAWNAAALFFRGERTWLNPVVPALPDDYVAGCLGSSVPAATATAAAAVAAKARQ